MKQFGTTHLKQRFCRCCVPMDSPRAKVKLETEKLIREDQDDVVYFGNTVPKSEKSSYCPVCGDYENENCITEC
jgi:hypothetical protein